MNSRAVVYTATAGYLFQTVVSALQAQDHAPSDTDIVICFLGAESTAEYRLFRTICDEHGVSLLCGPTSILNGLHPTYARMFLDQLVPGHIDQILYLDGDTQVVGALDALLDLPTADDEAFAALDPMVFIHRVSPRFRSKIDSWWGESSIPMDVRRRYVNAGVLRISRAGVTRLREGIMESLGSQLPALRFHDQDAINLWFGDKLYPISMVWNFPGFLLDGGYEAQMQPRVIHFMSNPRPWNAALTPWGDRYHRPYVDLVARYPEARTYWTLLKGKSWVKAVAQQQFKKNTEARIWRSDAARAAITDLECNVVTRPRP